MFPKSTRTIARDTHLHIQLFVLILKVSNCTCTGTFPFSIWSLCWGEEHVLCERPLHTVPVLFEIHSLLGSATTHHVSFVLSSAQHRAHIRKHNPVCTLVHRLALPLSSSVMTLGKPLTPPEPVSSSVNWEEALNSVLHWVIVGNKQKIACQVFSPVPRTPMHSTKVAIPIIIHRWCSTKIC